MHHKSWIAACFGDPRTANIIVKDIIVAYEIQHSYYN